MSTILLLIPTVLGFLALALGLRGRRVGTATHCRKCCFDLTGVFPEHETCPECGSPLTAPRDVTRGLRRRRWGLLAVGVIALAFTATFSTLASRDVITKARLAGVLPTRTLIALGVDRPDGWLADESTAELFDRLVRARYSPEDATRLSNALIAVLSRPDFPEYQRNHDLLLTLLASANTPVEVRQQYTEFLLDRVVRTDLPWVAAWGGDLLDHRAKGYIPDARWNEVLTQLITPRLWCSSGEVVEPGEVFVLRTNYLSSRIEPAGGIFLERTEAVDCVSGLNNPGSLIETNRYGMHMPVPSRDFGDILIAGDHQSSDVFVIHTWYAEDMDDINDVFPEVGLTHPGTVHVRATLPIAVRPSVRETPQNEPDIKQWLQNRMLPAVQPRIMRGRGSSSSPELDAVISVLAPTPTAHHNFILRGSLMMVGRNGARTHIGNFDVTASGSYRECTWKGNGHRSMSGMDSTGQLLKELIVQIPEQCLLPRTTSRAVLLFDHVTLPDGRTFDAKSEGSSPIEIDVPFDPDAGGFHW